MTRILATIGLLATALVTGLLWAGTARAQVDIPGVNGPTIDLVAKTGYISTPDGNSIFMWGYAHDDGINPPVMQYTGPTMIVDQGQTVTVKLTNNLAVATSIVFPGQTGVTAAPVAPSIGVPGVLTLEADPGETVQYSFTASQPGTFQYHSGTRPDLQVEMGLVGALIVRPTGFSPSNRTVYGHSDSRFYHEYLILLTGMDVRIHEDAEIAEITANPALLDAIDTTGYHPVYWFINGRSLPDTLLPNGVPWLPSQPYGSFVQTHPGERVLTRFIGGGKHAHPFHTHGNNLLLVGRDGEILQSAPLEGADLSFSKNTTSPVPGSTWDGIFQWTGIGMGWDIYGTPADGAGLAHSCVDALDNDPLDNYGTGGPDGFDDTTWEWCADHYQPTSGPEQYTKRLPVILPGLQDMTIGGLWGGSPYLGQVDFVPPGEGGLNPNGGYAFPWHSHHEKEVVNNDVFPGGNFTIFVVQAYGVAIP